MIFFESRVLSGNGSFTIEGLQLSVAQTTMMENFATTFTPYGKNHALKNLYKTNFELANVV